VEYAVGFARPDRWRQGDRVDAARPWHAVEALRPAAELDGEVELAVCGAIVQVWGRHDWDRLAAGRTACAECVRLTTPPAVVATPRPGGLPPGAPRPAGTSGGRHLRAVS
jgi:hypothetical protein